jgi:dolichyl-phosphate-mannose--protein O-mannosyl transferase
LKGVVLQNCIMSSISVSCIDQKVTVGDLRSIFRQFGCITDLKYNRDPKKQKKQLKARIYFRDENSAIKACEFDGYYIEGRQLDVKIYGRGQGGGRPTDVKRSLLSATEKVVILVIAALSFFLRFRNIAKDPNVVVSGESYTGYWINSYINGERFFDWDPPLAKMIYAGYARLVGYKGDFDFKNTTLPENVYPDNFYMKIRAFPCFCGSLVAPIVVAGLLIRHTSIPSALVAGILLSLDFSLIVQSRFISVDPITYLFVALTIFFTCLLYRRNTNVVFFFQCFFAVCAFCSKFVAGTIFALVFVSNYRIVGHKKDGVLHVFMRTAFLVWLAIMGIWFTMWAHLALTPKWGEGDRYTKRSLRAKSFTTQIPLILYDMYRIKRDEGVDHIYHSRWFEWPFFRAVPALVWSTETRDRVICAFNNPAAAFASVLGVFVCFLYGIWDWTFGYCATYFIYSVIKGSARTTYYTIPLIIGICSFAAALDRMHRPFRYAFTVIFLSVAVYAFIFWSSWVYGDVQTALELSERAIWPRLRSLWRVK